MTKSVSLASFARQLNTKHKKYTHAYLEGYE